MIAIPKKNNKKSPFMRNRPNVIMTAVESQMALVDTAFAVSFPIHAPSVAEHQAHLTAGAAVSDEVSETRSAPAVRCSAQFGPTIIR
jgi:hypothetical protein